MTSGVGVKECLLELLELELEPMLELIHFELEDVMIQNSNTLFQTSPSMIVRVAYSNSKGHRRLGYVRRSTPAPPSSSSSAAAASSSSSAAAAALAATWLYSVRDLRRQHVDAGSVLADSYVDSDHYHQEEPEVVAVDCHPPVDARWIYSGGILVRRNTGDAELSSALRPLDQFLRAAEGLWNTSLGARWRILLDSLLRLGNAGSSQGQERRRQLQQALFDQEGEPCSVDCTLIPLEPVVVRDRCDACGLPRTLTQAWAEMQWRVGPLCATKLEALVKGCAALSDLRLEARGSLPHLPQEWLEKKQKQLDEVYAECMEANAARPDLLGQL